MIVEEISPQAVVHDSGAVVASTGRTSFVYARGGRTISLTVEPLETYFVRLPEAPTWSDGNAVSQSEADQLLSDVADTFTHWGERCEFVAPDDPRVLRTVDDVAGWIRAAAGR